MKMKLQYFADPKSDPNNNPNPKGSNTTPPDPKGNGGSGQKTEPPKPPKEPIYTKSQVEKMKNDYENQIQEAKKTGSMSAKQLNDYKDSEIKKLRGKIKLNQTKSDLKRQGKEQYGLNLSDDDVNHLIDKNGDEKATAANLEWFNKWNKNNRTAIEKHLNQGNPAKRGGSSLNKNHESYANKLYKKYHKTGAAKKKNPYFGGRK